MGLQILVADDDEIALLIQTTVIKKCGLGDPKSFPNGDLLHEYLKNNIQENHKFLIFLDVNMPGTDSWILVDLFKKMQTEIYIIIVTASINQSDKDEAAKHSNVIGFIEKPMKKEDCDGIKVLPHVAEFFV